MIAILLAPIYILVNVYIYWRIMGWLKVGFPSLKVKKNRIISIIIYAFFSLSFLEGFLMPDGYGRRVMKVIGNYWLGVLLYMILIIITADVIRLILVYVFKRSKEKLCSVHMHRIVGGFCAFAIAAVSILGVVNAGIVRVTPYEISVDKNAGTIESVKVVLIADLHLGYNIGTWQMKKMVDQINRQDADLVVIAGDIFDNEWEAVGEPEKLIEILRGIKSQYGVYACYGNHDIEEPILAGFTFGGQREKYSSPEMDEFLKKAGIQLLQDESVLIEDQIYLYGRADARRPGKGIVTRKSPKEITAEMDPDKPVFVIDHEPLELQELAEAGVDVDLCGHTHDGQMFPGNLTIRLLWENAYGYMKKGNMHNIVTSGVGVFGPNMRVGTKAEICPVTVHFTKSASKNNEF